VEEKKSPIFSLPLLNKSCTKGVIHIFRENFEMNYKFEKFHDQRLCH
jgi:hypothetical protein